MKSLLNKKFVLISLITVLLIGTGIATTLAYLRSTPEELTNTFTVGNVTTEILENRFEQIGKTRTFYKEPYVKNTGANDCYVRARVVCSPENAIELVFDQADSNWVKIGDYYYYLQKLSSGESTGYIFTGLEVIDDTIDSFEVTVYQEAVQDIVYKENGDTITNMYKIWEWYDNGGRESSAEVPADNS